MEGAESFSLSFNPESVADPLSMPSVPVGSLLHWESLKLEEAFQRLSLDEADNYAPSDLEILAKSKFYLLANVVEGKINVYAPDDEEHADFRNLVLFTSFDLCINSAPAFCNAKGI